MAEQPQQASIAEQLADILRRMERLEASMDSLERLEASMGILMKADERVVPVPPLQDQDQMADGT
jgi:negative regulator of replication initiation